MRTTFLWQCWGFPVQGAEPGSGQSLVSTQAGGGTDGEQPCSEGLLVEERLDMSWQWTLTAQKEKHIQSAMGSREGRGLCSSALLRPHLQRYILLWDPSTGRTWKSWSRPEKTTKLIWSHGEAGAPLLQGKTKCWGSAWRKEGFGVILFAVFQYLRGFIKKALIKHHHAH